MRIKCIKNRLKTSRYARLHRKGQGVNPWVAPFGQIKNHALCLGLKLSGVDPWVTPLRAKGQDRCMPAPLCKGDDLKGHPILFQSSFLYI